MPTTTISKRFFGLLAVTLAATICAVFLFSDSVTAKGKPGGGGGGGGEPPANFAFVHSNVWDGGLFLTTSDGSVSQRLTKAPKGGDDRFAVWSPDLDADPSNGCQ